MIYMRIEEDSTGRLMDMFHTIWVVLVFLWSLLNWLWNRQIRRRVGRDHRPEALALNELQLE